MSVQQPAAAPHSVGLGVPMSSIDDRPWHQIGLSVDVRTTLPGLVELDAASEYLLTIHAGPPVRGGCRSHRFVYTRGDIDLFPAGASDIWEEEQASTSLIVRLAPSLLRRAAEEIGLGPDRADLAPRHQFRDPQIEHIAWALDAERRSGHPSGLLYTEGLGLALALRLLGPYPTPTQAQAGLSASQLRRVTDYVEEHLDRDLSLGRFAGVAGSAHPTSRPCSGARRGCRYTNSSSSAGSNGPGSFFCGVSCRPARWRSKRASRTRATWRGGCGASSG
jgi:hypothetical protein